MRIWDFESGVRVVEAEHNASLHRFIVYDGEGHLLGGIYPPTVEDFDACVADLDKGSDPIADGWEDGNGNPCNPHGWGLSYSLAVADDYHSRTWMPAFEDWRDAVKDFREAAEEANEPLSDSTEVFLNSGEYNGTRVWCINWAWGTAVTMSSLDTDPADWWDEEWDSEVDADE